jgi:hypothetical protein
VPVNWITYYSCTIRPILISTFNFKFIISFIFNLDIWFHWMCRWTNSNWASLNEPPVMEAPTNKYASQFHIANLGSTKTNTGQHGIGAWLIIGIVLSNSTLYIHVMNYIHECIVFIYGLKCICWYDIISDYMFCQL